MQIEFNRTAKSKLLIKHDTISYTLEGLAIIDPTSQYHIEVSRRTIGANGFLVYYKQANTPSVNLSLSHSEPFRLVVLDNTNRVVRVELYPDLHGQSATLTYPFEHGKVLLFPHQVLSEIPFTEGEEVRIRLRGYPYLFSHVITDTMRKLIMQKETVGVERLENLLRFEMYLLDGVPGYIAGGSYSNMKEQYPDITAQILTELKPLELLEDTLWKFKKHIRNTEYEQTKRLENESRQKDLDRAFDKFNGRK